MIRHKIKDRFFKGRIVDVKDGGYIIKVESRGKHHVSCREDMLVDLEHEADRWELWERLY